MLLSAPYRNFLYFSTRASPGFSGAQLEALVNSGALMAAARGSDSIEAADLEEARLRGRAVRRAVRR